MKTILLVDDLKDYHRKFGDFFARHGFKVEFASSIEEAKQKILAKNPKPFDLILTDQDFSMGLRPLHRLDGLKLVQWCKKQGIKSRIVLTSSAFGNRVGRIMNSPLIFFAKRAGAEIRKKGVEHFADLVRPK